MKDKEGVGEGTLRSFEDCVNRNGIVGSGLCRMKLSSGKSRDSANPPFLRPTSTSVMNFPDTGLPFDRWHSEQEKKTNSNPNPCRR
ncbi:UPF0431 protein C1orf66-like protein [Anopheles sinensis]|uniref:UPF0431 protein C1orf66-like protein n=1 Tax=Anopheles sinensis TaxID=74873 RepID=A0A084VL76_ANOSI|nr:UPF0431 protein C1orf66-like protein [Anopheles sinensis]